MEGLPEIKESLNVKTRLGFLHENHLTFGNSFVCIHCAAGLLESNKPSLPSAIVLKENQV